MQTHGDAGAEVATFAAPTAGTRAHHMRSHTTDPRYGLVGFTECRPYPPRTRPPRSKSSVTARLSDDQLLDLLREVLKKQGFLNRRVIDSAEGIPHSATYVKRFGSMKRAYRLAGFLGNPQRC